MHVSDGLFFDREENGNVTLTKTDGKSPKDGGRVIFTQTFDAGHWASIILSMSSFGERPGDWHAWIAHHNGTQDILEGRRGGY